jgi:hypothetical protein
VCARRIEASLTRSELGRVAKAFPALRCLRCNRSDDAVRFRPRPSLRVLPPQPLVSVVLRHDLDDVRSMLASIAARMSRLAVASAAGAAQRRQGVLDARAAVVEFERRLAAADAAAAAPLVVGSLSPQVPLPEVAAAPTPRALSPFPRAGDADPAAWLDGAEQEADSEAAAAPCAHCAGGGPDAVHLRHALSWRCEPVGKTVLHVAAELGQDTIMRVRISVVGVPCADEWCRSCCDTAISARWLMCTTSTGAHRCFTHAGMLLLRCSAARSTDRSACRAGQGRQARHSKGAAGGRRVGVRCGPRGQHAAVGQHESAADPPPDALQCRRAPQRAGAYVPPWLCSQRLNCGPGRNGGAAV